MDAAQRPGVRAKNVTLIALWNGKASDGPGGTEDMIRQAEARGATVKVLDARTFFGA